MKSPFKFLSAYSKEDKAVFFGREEESRILYDLVKKNRLVLVYGPSGTGKTSLVSCGLAGKFESTDWFPVKINRGENINESFSKALSSLIDLSDRDKNDMHPLELIGEIYAENLRPVYLIFDQFEELFIFGSKEEQIKFIDTLNSVMNAQLPCRVLIIIREEYLARLYQFESKIQGIIDRRLRVEPMSREKLLNVVKSSCASFNVLFDEPVKTPEKIVDNLIQVRAGMALPYLQVYMDMLYKRDFLLTYQRERSGNELPELKFTLDEINEFGEIENVLELFLNEQIAEIYDQLGKENPVITNEFIYQILDVFVSESGTKRPIKYHLINGEKTLPVDLLPGINNTDRTFISQCLKALENNRVLLDNEGSLELAHDSLAAMIDKTRSDKQRRINLVRKRLENAYFEFEASQITLTKDQLYDIQKLSKGLQPYLKPEWISFIQRSEDVVAKEENLKLIRERRKWRSAILLAIIGFSLAGLATYFYFISKKNEKKVRELTEQNIQASVNEQLQVAKSLEKSGNYQEAIDILEATRRFAAKEEIKMPDTFNIVFKDLKYFAKLVATGDSLINTGELEKALEIYETVYKQDTNKIIEYKVLDANHRMESYQINLSQAARFENVKEYKEAKDRYHKALIAKPNDPRVLIKLKDLEKKGY